MSLMIDVDKVSHVLLADGWHEVHDSSFTLDAYEYVWANDVQKKHGDFDLMHGGGKSGVCATGFTFHEVWNEAVGGEGRDQDGVWTADVNPRRPRRLALAALVVISSEQHLHHVGAGDSDQCGRAQGALVGPTGSAAR